MGDNNKERDAGRRYPSRRRQRRGPGRRGMILAAAAAAAATAVLSGCSPSSSTATPPPPTSKLVRVPGSSVPDVVLTPLGAQRIGLQTAPVTVAWNGEATFPYAALLYEPNGQAAVYVASGQLTFTRHFVNVGSVTSTTATALSGVTPGERVVTDGAEELLGVQNGVGEETR
jgi:hypothetical protein